jgi:hypothetical protein
MGNKPKSDFLVSAPSAVSGAARLFDWYGQFDEYNISRDGAEADQKALCSDWRLVGEDLRDAMSEYEASRSA